MKRVSISAVQPADQAAVVELLVAQMREHGVRRTTDELSRIVAQVLADEQYGFFLQARMEERIVGVAYVAMILSVEHGARVGWLEELYVAPEQRAQGIGSALLGAVWQRAREFQLAALDLEVDIEHRRAESLYVRFGFRRLPRSRWVKETGLH
ncbi:MAG: GNAT family N-acetyltransferase [Verrucomicrobia bacterium]|nr:GNAT family N-acetyltransferase [Verrucomicrobiota bacterium]